MLCHRRCKTKTKYGFFKKQACGLIWFSVSALSISTVRIMVIVLGCSKEDPSTNGLLQSLAD